MRNVDIIYTTNDIFLKKGDIAKSMIEGSVSQFGEYSDVSEAYTVGA